MVFRDNVILMFLQNSYPDPRGQILEMRYIAATDRGLRLDLFSCIRKYITHTQYYLTLCSSRPSGFLLV